MTTSTAQHSAKVHGQLYYESMKTSKYIVLILLLTVLSLAAFGQRSSCKVSISFNYYSAPTAITLTGDSATLFHYTNQTSEYRGIYYLFTDVHQIEIAADSKLAKGCTLTFNPYDTESVWISGDTLPNNTVIDQNKLNGHPFSFKWNERAHLLINANYRGEPDKSKTLFLVVLPMPPEDTCFSSIINDIRVDKRNGTLSGTVTLYRTGRVVIDSVYVEGEKAPTTFRNGASDHDTPYYRKQTDAKVKIDRQWIPGTEDIGLTVFFRQFNNDGTITNNQKDIRIDLFGNSFFEEYWWAFVALGIALLVLAIMLIFRRRRNNNPESIQQLQSKIKQLTKENERFSRALVKANELLKSAEIKNRELQKQADLSISYQEQIQTLNQEVERLSQPTQAAIDEATFLQKCDQLIEEIEKIRGPLHGNPAMADLDEKLRQLEKIIINTKQ